MDLAKREGARHLDGPGGLKCDCCGALHSGGGSEAKRRLRRVVRRSMKQRLAAEAAREVANG